MIERSRPVKRARVKPKQSAGMSGPSLGFVLTERKWTEHGKVELQINSVALFNTLAGRAMRSQRGRAYALHGMIRTVVRSRTEINVTEINNPEPEGYEIVEEGK